MKTETINTNTLASAPTFLNGKPLINFSKVLALILVIMSLVCFVSCENELTEDFVVEIDPVSLSYSYYTVDEIDFFLLDLLKIPDSVVIGFRKNPEFYWTPEPSDYVFEQKRLNKGDVLRLDNLEPGFYSLGGSIYKVTDSEPFEQYIGWVTGKSNNMDEDGYIIVERGIPTVIKLYVSFSQ